MSEKTVEIVRQVTDHFNETRRPGPMELYDAEVAFITRGDVGSAEIYTGHQGVDLKVDEAWLYRFYSGKVTRVEQHESRHRALEAAGLRE